MNKLLIVYAVVLINTEQALAQLQNPLGDTTLTQLFTNLLDALIVLAVPIIVFFIIYAGFQYVTAQGNEQQITNAHRALLYALVGGLLILGASGLIAIVDQAVTDMGG